MTIHLRSLAKEMKSAGAPERVEARLLAAFDEFALTQFPAPSVSARQHRVNYLIGAIAAVLLIVLGLFAIRWSAPATKEGVAPLVAETGSPANTGITTPSRPPTNL